MCVWSAAVGFDYSPSSLRNLFLFITLRLPYNPALGYCCQDVLSATQGVFYHPRHLLSENPESKVGVSQLATVCP